jgi:hypothetical protein
MLLLRFVFPNGKSVVAPHHRGEFDGFPGQRKRPSQCQTTIGSGLSTHPTLRRSPSTIRSIPEPAKPRIYSSVSRKAKTERARASFVDGLKHTCSLRHASGGGESVAREVLCGVRARNVRRTSRRRYNHPAQSRKPSQAAGPASHRPNPTCFTWWHKRLGNSHPAGENFPLPADTSPPIRQTHGHS